MPLNLIVAEHRQFARRGDGSVQCLLNGGGAQQCLFAAFGAAKFTVADRGDHIDLIANRGKLGNPLPRGIGHQIFVGGLHRLALARGGIGHIGRPQGFQLEDGGTSHLPPRQCTAGDGLVAVFGKHRAVEHFGVRCPQNEGNEGKINGHGISFLGRSKYRRRITSFSGCSWRF